jgi:hypothetical protein
MNERQPMNTQTVAAPAGRAPDPAEIARGAELRAQPRPRLFRAVWRWHFYAGLLVIPIIVILSQPTVIDDHAGCGRSEEFI